MAPIMDVTDFDPFCVLDMPGVMIFSFHYGIFIGHHICGKTQKPSFQNAGHWTAQIQQK
jgi:hypothetical protein